MKKRKRNNFGYYIKEGVTSIFTHGFMSFASVTIIVACLIIMGCFTLLALNINTLIASLESKNEITAYVDEALTDAQAVTLESQVLAVRNVSDAEFVSREQAMDEFLADYDDAYFEEIDSSVFRHRYIVYMDDISLMQETKDALYQIDGVAKVNAYTEIAKTFISVRNVISVVFLGLTAIFLIISIFIISNTTKLATFDRREEIAIMKMVGAENSFIRWPFVFEGFILGIFAAVVAFFIQWGLYNLVAEKVMGTIAGELVSVIPFGEFNQYLLAIFLGTGFIVGVIGSMLAIRKYLKV